MKKQNIFIIGLILLAVISFIIFILVSGSGNKGSVETPKDINAIINTINKNNKDILPELETMKVDIKNIDEVTSYTGLKTNDGIESIVVSVPVMTAQAYSVAVVKIKTSDDLYDLFKTSLKINEENIVTEDKSNFEKYNYTSSNIDITYYEEGTKLDINLVKEEINKLETSIAKRTNLLNNENYVNKAPQNIVELDRVKLKEEKEKLESLKKLI